MNMKKIYILKKKKLMHGPFSLEHLKEKGVKSDDLVWYEGLADWVSATDVDFLKPFLVSELAVDIRKKSLLQKVLGFLR